MRSVPVRLILAALLCMVATSLNAQVVTGNFATGMEEPWGIAIDNANNLYVADFEAGNIYKFAAVGGVVTGGAAGAAFATGLTGPSGLVLDSSQNLYVANWNGGTITKFAAAGGVVTGGAAGASIQLPG